MELQGFSEEDAEGAAAIKPMTSPLNWTLLGLLIKSPGYGSQVRQRCERVYGDDLPLSSDSRVYTALNELKRRGLIEEVPGKGTAHSGTDRQPKVRYRATVEGVRSYREWMLAQACEDRRQSRLFVRQLAVFEGEPEVAQEILEHLEKAYLREIGHTPIAAEDSSGLADRLVSEESRRAMEGRLPLVEYARKLFGSLPGRGASG